MTFHATPNLNGNSPQSFIEAASNLSIALTQAEAALAHISAEIMHGRNYQTSSTPDRDRAKDTILLQQAYDDIENVRVFARAIAKATTR